MVSQGTWGGHLWPGAQPRGWAASQNTRPRQAAAKGTRRGVVACPPKVISCTQGRVKGMLEALLCTKASKTPPFLGGWQGVNPSCTPCT